MILAQSNMYEIQEEDSQTTKEYKRYLEDIRNLKQRLSENLITDRDYALESIRILHDHNVEFWKRNHKRIGR